MAITDKLNKVSNGSQPLPAQLSAPKVAGATTASLSAATGWDTTTAKHIRMYQTQVVNGQTVPNQSTICFYKATLSGTTLSNIQLIWSATGSDQDYPSGATVDLSLTAGWADDLIDSVSAQHNHDGTHKAITAPSAVFSGTVTAANFLQSGGAGAEGWTLGLPTPNTVTYNGNRSYDLVFNGDDITDTVSPGMRLRTTRTVAAPTQCADLEAGSNQYFSKSSPAGMTFTDDFTCMAWVKLESYAIGGIISRYDGSNGWIFNVNASGQMEMFADGADNQLVRSYQSLPLNKWVHVAATMDMNNMANSVMYIDGVLVPSTDVSGAGTSLTQAGNLNIGAYNGANFFDGKIAQAALFSSVLSAGTIRSYMSQGLAGTETNLVSAYSFNGAITDLNTTNANNLTASGAAVATNADSPFGTQASGSISSTLDYAIIQKATFSTNTTLTVQVPEGNTIPTSGGVSAVAYSTQKAPYGMPVAKWKWRMEAINQTQQTQAAPVINTWYNLNVSIIAPVGEWSVSYKAGVQGTSSAATDVDTKVTLSTANNSESDKSFTSWQYLAPTGGGASPTMVSTLRGDGSLVLSSSASYYLNISRGGANTSLLLRGDIVTTTISLENAYL